MGLTYYGNPILRKKCLEVKEINTEIRAICKELCDIVVEREGAGLAAPQIGYDVRIFVSCYGPEEDERGYPVLTPPKLYINPKLSDPSEKQVAHGEGCLSIPGIYEEVTRPFEITVEAIDISGNTFTERAQSWHARCIMHENDHLNGVLFIDRIPAGRRKRIEADLKKLKKKFCK